MFENKARVLLILPADVLVRARVFVGRATATLGLPVSLQMVLRALIEEGLTRPDTQALLANVEEQVQAVRRIRSLARAGGAAGGPRGRPALAGGSERPRTRFNIRARRK